MPLDVRAATGAGNVYEIVNERGCLSTLAWLDQEAGFAVLNDLLH